MSERALDASPGFSLAVVWATLAGLLAVSWPIIGPNLSAPLWLVASALIFAMLIAYGFSRAAGSPAGRTLAFLVYAMTFGAGMFYLGAVNEHRGHESRPVLNVITRVADPSGLKPCGN